MLASTVKFSKYNRHPTPTTSTARGLGRAHNQKNQPTHTTRANQTPQKGARPARAGTCRPILQDPTTCQTPHPPSPTFHCRNPHEGSCRPVLVRDTRTVSSNRCSTLEHPLPHVRGQTGLCHHQTSWQWSAP